MAPSSGKLVHRRAAGVIMSFVPAPCKGDPLEFLAGVRIAPLSRSDVTGALGG